MKQRNKKILSFLIIFSLVFSNINIGILTRNVFAEENSVQAIINNNEEVNLKNMQVTTPQAVMLEAAQENNTQEVTVNEAIQAVIDCMNKEYYNSKGGTLEGEAYAAMFKAGADIGKKRWSVNKDASSLGLKAFGSKVTQALVLMDLNEDPTTYKGVNLIKDIAEEISKINSPKDMGINEVKGLILLDRYNEKFSDKKVDYNLDNAIKNLVKAQKSDGSINNAPQHTTAALVVLNKHKDVDGVNECTDKALDYLHGKYTNNGALVNSKFFTGPNAEAVMWFAQCGEELISDKWIKDDKGIIESLFNSWDGKKFVNSSGSMDYPPMPKVLYALASLKESGHGDYLLKGVKFHNIIKEEPEKTCKANIVIVCPKEDKTLDIKLSPTEVAVSSKKQFSGLTVLGALQAATDKCEFKGNMVTSIFDIKNEDSNGWIYSLNGKVPDTYANETIIKDGDKIVWYYSKNGMASKIPTYDEIVNEINNPDQKTQQVTVNDAIRVLTGYYNKEYYLKKNKKLEAWDYVALKKAEGELTKKDWKTNSAIPKTGNYDSLSTLAGKAKQSIILLELGEDPSDYKGRNLIKEIAEELDKTTNSRFIINEITGMIAVDRFNEAHPNKIVNYNVENLIKLVLKEQKPSGCVDGTPQNTAYAIEVFVRHEKLEGVNEAKKKAIDYLKDVIKSDGGLYEKYYFTHLQAEAVRELIKAGEFKSVKDWSKDNKSIIDGLFIYWNGKFFTDKYGKMNEFPYADTLYTLTLLRDAGYGDCVFNGIKFDNVIKEEPEKTCKANIVIVYPKDDKKLEIKLNPTEVVVSNKKQFSGLTVLGALQAATDKCEFKGNMVTSIFDIKNEGSNGWIYSLNGKVPDTYANETNIKDGDKIVWYYSKNGMESKMPTYDEIVKQINNPGEETQKDSSSINSVINGVVGYYNEKHFIENQGQLECFHYGAMAKAGADLTKKPWFFIEKYVTNYDKNLSQFGSKVKQSLILLDIGKNPLNFSDRNLIDEIVKEIDFKEGYFRQIDIQAIIAIDKYNEKFKDKKVNYNVEHAVKRILEAQGEDGGFKERKSSVPINTAYALSALSKHRDIEGVNESINKAIKYLHGLQKEDGSIYETKFITGYHAEIIQGLIAAGEDLTSKEWIKSSGKNPVDALFTLWKDNNSFDNALGESKNNRGWIEATNKALYALVDLREAGYGEYKVKGIKVKDFNGKDDNKDEITCKVNVAIVVPKDHKYDCMFKPKEVIISNKKHSAGVTVLGALQSATALYQMTGSMVTSIYGIENKGFNGWVYTVNGIMPNDMAGDVKLKEGDKVIWYYSMGGMDIKVPTWNELTGTKPEKKPNYKDYIKEVDSTIESVSNIILKGTVGDWHVASLAALGKNIPENYLKDITEKIKNRDKSLFKNGKFEITTNCERTIIGIVAAGGDPRNIGNYNLLEDLCSRKLIKEPNLYAYMYGLIALDSGKFSLPKNADFTREQLVDKILSLQTNQNGWGWGVTADVDTTAMVIIALSNYTNNPKVKVSVDKAVEFLSKSQNQNGGYEATWDEEKGKDTSESVSQTIIALCALGIDPASDKFTKNNNNLMDNFLSFKTEDGGFAHIKDNLKTANPLATEQALRALAAYKRFKDGKTGSIYLLKEFKDENAKDIEIVNLTTVSEFRLGSEAKINVKATNNKDEAKPVTLIIGVFDSNDKMINYVALKYVVKSKDEIELEGMMKLPKDGQYVVKSFMWDSLEGMNSLSNVISIPVLK